MELANTAETNSTDKTYEQLNYKKDAYTHYIAKETRRASSNK